MRLDELPTDEAILAEIGHRLERHRVARNRTQAELAAEAGIGRATLQRIERGESVQATSLVKLLRTLGLLTTLDDAIPEIVELPIARLERERRRVRRGGRDDAPQPDLWTWGDEPGRDA